MYARMRVVLSFLTLSLAGCIPYPVQETPHVSGIVVDAATKRPVAGAHVMWDRYQETPVFTDGLGRFDIPVINQVEMIFLGPYDRFGEDRYLIIDAARYSTLRVKANTWRGPVGETFSLKHE